MVKIPNLDELKKMGSNLIDSAKSVKFGEMADKLKSGIESVTGGVKKAPVSETGEDPLRATIASMHISLQELIEAHIAQVKATKRLQNQISDLEKAIKSDIKVEEPKQ